MTTSAASSAPPPQRDSDLEASLANLLEGPFDKVSVTMPSALRARIAAQAVDTNFSAYVSQILAREVRRLALVDFLDEMETIHGPTSAQDLAEADRRWEEMWSRHDSSAASSSTPQH